MLSSALIISAWVVVVTREMLVIQLIRVRIVQPDGHRWYQLNLVPMLDYYYKKMVGLLSRSSRCASNLHQISNDFSATIFVFF